MNAQTILEAISGEKEKFLAKYDDKAYFDKETSGVLKTFNKIENESNLNTVWTLLIILAAFIGFPASIILSTITYNFFLNLLGITSSGMEFFFGIFSYTFSFTCLFYAPLKTVFRKILNSQYKNRKNNNAISDLFSSDFYKTTISDEIQNMLKVFLPDNTYVELRKGNKEITYGKARLALLDIIERDSLLDEKREIFLTPDEIKQYSYAK